MVETNETDGPRNNKGHVARRLRRQHYRLAQMDAGSSSIPELNLPQEAIKPKHGPASEAEKIAERLREQLARTQAEFDNYRKRQRREEQQRAENANLQLIEQLLPVLDNFGRAMRSPGESVSALMSGVEMIHNQLNEILRQSGVERIEAQGQPFDPKLHEAVATAPAEEGQQDNEVIDVYQDGYQLKGRLIRPAMVKVARTQ